MRSSPLDTAGIGLPSPSPRKSGGPVILPFFLVLHHHFRPCEPSGTSLWGAKFTGGASFSAREDFGRHTRHWGRGTTEREPSACCKQSEERCPKARQRKQHVFDRCAVVKRETVEAFHLEVRWDWSTGTMQLTPTLLALTAAFHLRPAIGIGSPHRLHVAAHLFQ